MLLSLVIGQIIQEDAALTKRLRTARSCASRPADFFPLTVLPNAPDRMPLLDGSWLPRSAFGIHCLWWQTRLVSSEPEHQSASELQMVLHVRCAVLQLGPQPLGLQRAEGEAPRKAHVDASADLESE